MYFLLNVQIFKCDVTAYEILTECMLFLYWKNIYNKELSVYTLYVVSNTIDCLLVCLHICYMVTKNKCPKSKMKQPTDGYMNMFY